MPRYLTAGMGAARGKKRLCIYCNHWSAKQYPVGTSSWLCTRCESQNWLDENGEPTDPPPVINTPPPRQYAARRVRSSIPEVPAGQGFIFCQRCLTNQQIYTRAIAEYFPDEDDPEYEKFEKGFDAYKKNLEEQYPQVCAKCEPLARAHMNAVSQEVRQNHLSQCLQWTKEKMGRKEPFRWMMVPHFVGGAMWILSLAIQLLWHLFYATRASEILDKDVLVDIDERPSIFRCATNASTKEHCLDLYAQAVLYSLYAAVACCWWNPKMGRKPVRARNKLLGLFQYYRLQFVSLTLRTLVWKALSAVSLDLNITQASHALALIFIGLLSVVSWRTVQWELQLKLNWTITDEPLVKPQPTSAQAEDQPFRSIPSSNPPSRLTRSHQAVNIDINDFGRGFEPRQRVQQVPTPPNEEEEDPDSMDWVPSQSHTFSPMRDYRSSQQPPKPAQPASTARSPFYGTLPANPRSQAAKLRNPQPIPRPVEMTPGPRDNPFKKAKGRDDDSVIGMSTTTSPAKFAQARFFAPGDDAETGLESMFSNAFRMKEEPTPVQQGGINELVGRPTSSERLIQPSPPQVSSEAFLPKFYRLGPLLLVCIIWINAAATKFPFEYIQGACLIVTAIVAASHIGPSRSLVSQLGFTVETIGLLYLGSTLIYSTLHPTRQMKSDTGDLGFWCVFSLLTQEIWVSFSPMASSSDYENRRPMDRDQRTTSPPRHPWDYEEEPEEATPSLTPSLHQHHSSNFGAPSIASSHQSLFDQSEPGHQPDFESPSPSVTSFGNAQSLASPHAFSSASHWKNAHRLGSERRPSFIPNMSGFSISQDVVAPRRSTRNQDQSSGRLGGLNLGGSESSYDGMSRRNRGF